MRYQQVDGLGPGLKGADEQGIGLHVHENPRAKEAGARSEEHEKDPAAKIIVPDRGQPARQIALFQ